MIPAFYKDREIFVTGGSGVVGKALIEKLLRSCNVGKIYLLMRPKRNATIEQRLEKIKRAMIFRRLFKEKPNEFDLKVTAIPGDALQPMLGITPQYAKQLENVSIVFHSAATIRFDEPLKDAIRLNVGGTLQTLRFAETLKRLEVFLHVSTFFSNPYLTRVEDKVYESPMDWKFCLNLCQRNDIPDEALDAITKKLIVGFANTYCFTKNLAESLVNEYRHKLPVVIYRPSIVVFAIDDPEEGYPPTLIGAMGLFAVAGAGILKALYISKGQRLDLSPQDIAIKSLLYYAMKSAGIYANGIPKEIPVFMTTSYVHSSITFPEYVRIMESHRFWIDVPLEKNLLIPGVVLTDNRLVYMFFVWLKQIIPALIVDSLLVLFGRKAEIMAIQRKVFTTLQVMEPFLFNNYESTGVSCHDEMLKNLDGTDFNLDPIRFTNKYFSNVGFCHDMVYKVREVLFKEDPSTLPRARIIIRAKILLYRGVQLYLAYKLYHMVMPMLSNWWRDIDSNNATEISY